MMGQIDESEKYLKQGKELLKKLTSQKERYSPSPLIVAESYYLFKKKEALKSQETLEKGISNFSQKGFLSYMAGNNFFVLNNYDKASFWFGEALKTGFYPAQCLYQLGRVALKKGKLSDSIVYFRYITENLDNAKFFDQTKAPDVFYHLGLVYLKKEDLELAKRAFEKGLELDGNHIPCMEGLVYYYYQKARNAKGKKKIPRIQSAEKWVRRILSLDNKNSFALQILSQLESVKNLKMWEDSFQRPDSPRPYNQWSTSIKGGGQIYIQNKKLVMEGDQKLEGEKNSLFREMDRKSFAKFEALVEPESSLANGCELGIILESESSTTLGYLKIFLNSQGVWYYYEAGGTAGIEKPQKIMDLPAKKVVKIYVNLKDRGKGIFQVGVEDKVVSLKLIRLTRGRIFRMSLYGTSPVGKKWKFYVTRIRIFKSR
ncbi:MAG: tetratricopeptide repeat protein [Planctomycetota bacterium]|nr:MAG: tetratricopeptide repeat protein [Planctomycetota bacterium]